MVNLIEFIVYPLLAAFLLHGLYHVLKTTKIGGIKANPNPKVEYYIATAIFYIGAFFGISAMITLPVSWVISKAIVYIGYTNVSEYAVIAVMETLTLMVFLYVAAKPAKSKN